METKEFFGVKQVLSAAGRTIRGDGQIGGYTRYLGRAKQAGAAIGDELRRKDGAWLVVQTGGPEYIDRDAAEDMDYIAAYKHGAGWYQTYQAVPVTETADEIAETAAKTETAEAIAARRDEIAIIVRERGEYKADMVQMDAYRAWSCDRIEGRVYVYGDRVMYSYADDEMVHGWTLRDAALATEAQGILA